MSDFLKAVTKAMDWTEDEARNFIGHFISDDPEKLRTDLEAACTWAKDIEKRAALIDVMKTMPARSMTVKWNGGPDEMTIRLSPEREEADGA